MRAAKIATPRSSLANFDQPQLPDDQWVAILKRRELRGREQLCAAQD
jgi:hypothetical protein